MTDLFTPIDFDEFTAKNRAVMAPLTRSRANSAGVLPPYAGDYYAQRASAGLLITEATSISPSSAGFINTPGIYTEEQTEAWRHVADMVHQKGGLIFMQVWHTGRIAHSSLIPGGEAPIAPSAIKAEGGMVFTAEGPGEPDPAREMTTAEVKQHVHLFRKAFENAKEAGLDGVEVHAANGFLISQFLNDSSNQRSDEYGGTIENRLRFAIEVTEAAVEVFGAGRVGIRISPRGMANDQRNSETEATFKALVEKLNAYKLAYLHVVETTSDAPEGRGLDMKEDVAPMLATIREIYEGRLMINSGYELSSANRALDAGQADLVAFGVPYIANPDLVERLKAGAPLNEADRDTFYTPGEKGYTDYPSLAEVNASAA